MSHDTHPSHASHDEHSPDMFKQKFWVSLLLTVPVLVFSQAIQTWLGFELWFPGSGYIPAIFGTIIFFYGGRVFLRSARGELAAKRPGMMTLISMAITVSFGYSLAITLGWLTGMDFWWELATLVTIMLLGHWVEMASVSKAQGALGELAKLLPDEAELVSDKGNQTVPLSSLRLGDRVLVRPGSRVPIDGVVVGGESEVDESMLTGESKPVPKSAGSPVIGGTLNARGAVTIEATKIGDDTALAGIMQLVEDAQSSKSKTQVLADRAAFYLTFIAIGAAIITWIGWGLAGASHEFILERVVTVLIIACPHALGLAIPLVTAISTTKAAKSGLLVRERKALESARNVDVVLFDKTGTLTTASQGVVKVVAASGSRLISIAAALERESEHPIARAIVEYADNKNTPKLEAKQFVSLPGRGVKAEVNGSTAYAGGPRLLEELDIQPDSKLQTVADEASIRGEGVVYVVKDQTVVGAIMLADTVRKESKQAVEDLQAMGKRVVMLTGDSRGVAESVSDELGMNEYFAEVLPEHKAEVVQELQSRGDRVAMVGDGVNDAPALAKADVGIAIGAGTDVAIGSAGIILASSDPRGVAKIIRLSKATYRKMLQNLVWATGYNALALPLAAGALAQFGVILSPAAGAVLMSVSTIVVAASAQLLRRVRL